MKKLLIFILVGYSIGSSFFRYATLYSSLTLQSPHQTDTFTEHDDNYSLNFGLRKIARFGYQPKLDYYDGTEESITDNAFMGAVNGWEYLFNVSSSQVNGLEFTDTKLWIRNAKDDFVYKFKYYDIGSRNLEFLQTDIRYRVSHNNLEMSAGLALLGHSAYGYDAFSEYDNFWWFLAYDYGFTDFSVPAFDLNGNGEIDDPYYVWIESDPETLEGYWVLFNEGTSYYWEDEDGNYVAGSDDEFAQYHLPHIIEEYNQDEIEALDFQTSASIVVGLDYYWNKEDFYFHTWGSVMPVSKGLTDYAFVDDTKYEIGLLLGYSIGNIGLFFETNYLNMFKEQYTVTTGINYQFK